MNIPRPKIYLASQSPRRRELLHQIGIEFGSLFLRGQGPRGADVSEEVQIGESPLDYVVRVTHEKASVAQQVMKARKLPPLPILVADTTVALDGQILGKPTDATEAATMLRCLSGRTHQVLTAVAIQCQDQLWQTTQVSEVTFTPLTDEMIKDYCATKEPYDKAGGYGIQGMAAIFIERISGSYSGIMGLPLFETAQLLRKAMGTTDYSVIR
jgi:septum formation protein